MNMKTVKMSENCENSALWQIVVMATKHNEKSCFISDLNGNFQKLKISII
jgi:hypothetical protein